MQARQNAQDMSRFQNEQQERRNFINEGYLKNHTLFPNTQLEGFFLQQRDRVYNFFNKNLIIPDSKDFLSH